MGKTKITSVIRGCAQYSHSTCNIMNAMLCPLNSTNVCNCGICSTNKCNDDRLKLSSEGSGQNVSNLMKILTNNLTTTTPIAAKSNVITSKSQINTVKLSTTKTVLKKNLAFSSSVRINSSFNQLTLTTILIFYNLSL
jgi:hypothetical protein